MATKCIFGITVNFVISAFQALGPATVRDLSANKRRILGSRRWLQIRDDCLFNACLCLRIYSVLVQDISTTLFFLSKLFLWILVRKQKQSHQTEDAWHKADYSG